MSLQRLRLYQLVSPALPVGAFSYAEGLEVLVQSGRLGDATALRTWLEAELARGVLCIEAAALPGLMRLLAQDDWAAVTDLDHWLLAQREAPELRAQQRQMGWSRQPRPGWPGRPPLPTPATASNSPQRLWWRPICMAGSPTR